jgi:predicted ribosome quality control (RQC) complex YloA/Tae2 family protein
VYGPFSNAEAACREVGTSILLTVRDDVIARRASGLKKLVSSRKRLLSALEQQQRDADSYETWRNEANVLAAYQSQIPSGASEVTLPDLYGSGVRSIALDPSVSITTQIKKRFKQAAKLERSRAAVEKRMRTVSEEIERIERSLAQAMGSDSLGAAVALIDECTRASGLGPGAPKAQRVRLEKQLRRFELDDQWFVLVGRSDRENDEITFRIASPDDLWFHAQHVAGSHVVLKSHGSPGNPPDSVLEAAAGIAAHYSKARRASVVPVIYTQRKYVRKFRGSKPGQVVCEREKTIFAEPRLPESAEE